MTLVAIVGTVLGPAARPGENGRMPCGPVKTGAQPGLLTHEIDREGEALQSEAMACALERLRAWHFGAPRYLMIRGFDH